MDTQELPARVASFPRWHYEFDLQGVKTPIFDSGHVNRHQQRVRYFFDPLVALFGGTLTGIRVLDLGCNAGFWSLKAIGAGCDYVLGIDARQMHIDQANLVFEANSVERSRYHFRAGNLFTDDLSADGFFEIVLCLGLLYHISKPVEFFEKVTAVNTDVLLIDTDISSLGGASLRFRRESLDEPQNSVDHETVFIPSRRAVVEMANSFGYTVVPLALNASSYRGMRTYLRGERLAFACAKQASLSSLARAPADEPFARLELATRLAFRAARAGMSAARLTTRSLSQRRRAVHHRVH